MSVQILSFSHFKYLKLPINLYLINYLPLPIIVFMFVFFFNYRSQEIMGLGEDDKK